MTESSSPTCPACGQSASGNFCAYCGASLGARTCAACGTELSPGAKFCHRCGTSSIPGNAASGFATAAPSAPRAGDSARGSGERAAWVIAAALCAITIAAVLYAANKRNPAEAPSMSNAGNAVTGIADAPGAAASSQRAPDISNLTPKQQFTRLEERIDSMLQHGDTTNVGFFMQMSLQAYANLPPADRDIDARYHAALRQAQLGSLDTARAMADTIMRDAPNNLLADVIRATVAEFAGDSTAARTARAAFREHYDAEMAKNRPEYVEHRPFLEQFRQTAAAK